MFEVEFLNTGFRTFATITCIRHGAVKDNLVPATIGIGYLGYCENIGYEEVKKYFATWQNMLRRCYDPNERTYMSYGGIGVVTVDPRWFNFTNFYYDIQQMYGFEYKKKYPRLYNLDKDYLQSNIPKSQRVYSKDTCVWASIYENIIMEGKESGSSGYYGVNIYKDGYAYTRINHIVYGRFKDVKVVAALFNHLYPQLKNPYSILDLKNDVPYLSLEEIEMQNLYVKRK